MLSEKLGRSSGQRLVEVRKEESSGPTRPEPVKPPEPPKEVVNSIGMKLKLIPAGEFLMGSPESDKDASGDEKPQHRVRITQPFYLGIHQVTRGQFERFVEATRYQTEAEKDGKGGYGWDASSNKWVQDPKFTWRSPGFDQTDDHPVVNVSWNDALAFCDWLSRQEGQTVPAADGGGVGIRLPGRESRIAVFFRRR